MTAFRSRWDDWEPKEPTLRTAKTDKSPSVSSVSAPPRRLGGTEGASVSSVSSSPRPSTDGNDHPNSETGTSPSIEGPQKTPTSLTDRTDKSIPQAFKLTPDKAEGETWDAAAASTKIVLLHCPPGVPEAWVQGICDLLAMAPPASCPAERWQTLREDSFTFLRDHAAQAHGLGWTALDLFGVHPEKPWVRFDCMGLVPLLNGAKVTALSDIEAVIEKPSGARVTFRKRDLVSDEACLIWNNRSREGA